MSLTIGGGYKGAIKQICRECNHTVYLVLVEGKRLITDPDLILVVPLGGTVALQARRIHSEQCLRYKSEAERLKAIAALKRKRAT